MPILVEITSDRGGLRAAETPGYPVANVNKMTFYVSLHKDGTWTLRRPIPDQWRYIIPDYASGFWHKDVTGIAMMDHTNEREVFSLRLIERGEGPAYHWAYEGNRGAWLYKGEGTWKPSPIPSQKMWAGIMGKVGGGLMVGAEGAFAYICNVGNENAQAVLAMGTIRAGISAGASGGLALVICTGFNSVQEMHNYSNSGADFTIAIGAKVSGFLKSTKLVATLKNFEGGLEVVEGAIHMGRESKVAQKVLSECPGAAKGITSMYGMLVDTDEKSIVAIDIPLAGYGAELGVFYGWSKTTVKKQW